MYSCLSLFLFPYVFLYFVPFVYSGCICLFSYVLLSLFEFFIYEVTSCLLSYVLSSVRYLLFVFLSLCTCISFCLYFFLHALHYSVILSLFAGLVPLFISLCI